MQVCTREFAATFLTAVDLVICAKIPRASISAASSKQGKPETAELIADIKRLNGKTVRPDSGITIKAISITGTRRIVKYALEYARKHGRKKVTAVHKANILKFSDGLFLEVAKLPRHIRTLSSKIALLTTCACSLCKSPSFTT